MTYMIYQLKRSEFHGKAFRGYAEVKEEYGEPQEDWYDLMYWFDSDDVYTNDELFEMFNLDRPIDFKGHSLSVSDVVGVGGRYWYCDDFGWVELDWE